MSSKGVTSKRKRLFAGRTSITDPDPSGFDYSVPAAWKIKLKGLVDDVNKELGDSTVDKEELMAAILFDAIDLFEFELENGDGKVGVPEIRDEDGYGKDDEDIMFCFPLFLSKLLIRLSSGTRWVRKPKMERMFIKYILLDNARHGAEHVAGVVENYRDIVRTLKEQEAKDGGKDAKD